MLFTDIKYANMYGMRQENYKVKRSHPYLSNFRCPFCGDSQYNKHKSRAYLIERDGSLFFYCHNCAVSMPFWKLLKSKAFNLYEEMCLEHLSDKLCKPKREDISNHRFVVDPAAFANNRKQIHSPSIKDQLVRLDQLHDQHPAKQYINARRIPQDAFPRLYVANDFGAWVAEWLPSKNTELARERGVTRLIIPALNFDRTFMGCSARLVLPNNELPRYYSLFRDDVPHVKLFGLERLDDSKLFVITEGALDSLLINNSVAMLGSNVSIPDRINRDNAIFCFDNEPRNKSIVNTMLNKSKLGYRVVVFPSTIVSKDINDMVLTGELSGDPIQIRNFLIDNSYTGLSAIAHISQWRRS